jgi:NitT/TauT family transport system substrate-binding protein
VLTFAERADSLGYLGRTGYNLDGIFYQSDLNPNAMVKQLNG